jgi:hypothetical protein
MLVMTNDQRKALVASTGLNKVVWHKEREKPGRFQVGVIDDVVSVIVGDYNFLIQRIKLTPETARRWGGGKYAYRNAYYTLATKSRRPTWGQYNALIPERWYRKLVARAIAKGWVGMVSGDEAIHSQSDCNCRRAGNGLCNLASSLPEVKARYGRETQRASDSL